MLKQNDNNEKKMKTNLGVWSVVKLQFTSSGMFRFDLTVVMGGMVEGGSVLKFLRADFTVGL